MQFNADSPCVSNAFNINQLKTLENQRFFILGMRFYPIKRQGHKHPIFQEHIIHSTVQNFANTNGGFVDYYAGVNPDLLTADQGGSSGNPGLWYTTDIIQNTKIADSAAVVLFTAPSPPCTSLCNKNHALLYPAIGTFKNFLAKYYQSPINT